MPFGSSKKPISKSVAGLSCRAGIVTIAGYAVFAATSAQAVAAQQYHSQNSDDEEFREQASKEAPPQIESRMELLERRLDAQESRIAELEQTVVRQTEEIAKRDSRIEAGVIETARLRQALAQNGSRQADQFDQTPARFRTAQATTNQGALPAPAVQDTQTDPAPAEEAVVAAAERPQSDKAVDQLLLDQGGVLLPRGKLQIEPSIDYTSISSDRVNISGFSIFNAILIGTIRVDDINRDILTGAVTARYGTGHRTQVDLRIPYVYRNDTETTGIGTGDALERSTTGNGLGDIGLTLAWQALTAKGGRPATILRVQAEYPSGKSAFEIDRVAPTEDSPERVLVEAPTGSGFYTVSPGVTFVWPIDPVVLFAGGAYNYTFGRRFDEFGFIEPGHGFEFFAGMNMSINEKVSMNFSFLDKQRFATRSGGIEIPGSGTHDARLSLGASVGISDRASLVFSSSTGLTDESPDFAFSVRLPIVF